MEDFNNPDNLAHHLSASSLIYKDWSNADVLTWLEQHLKITQYRDIFGK